MPSCRWLPLLVLLAACPGGGPGAPDVTDPAVGSYAGVSRDGVGYPIVVPIAPDDTLVLDSSTLTLRVDGRYVHACSLRRIVAGVVQTEPCAWEGTWRRSGRFDLVLMGDGAGGHGLPARLIDDTLSYTGDGGFEIYLKR